MSGTVLVLTREEDHFVPERVIEEVEALGFSARRVHTADYPLDLPLELALVDGAPRVRLDGLDDVVGVFNRRPGPARTGDLDDRAARWLAMEARLHWRAFQDLTASANWVNPPLAEEAVEGRKLRQLQAARTAGLRTPETLVTNDPEAARRFVDRQGGEVVVKLLGALGFGFERATHLPTTRLGPEDLDALEGLTHGPMCFQPLLRSRAEYRVTWVDGACFVGAMGGGEDPDWRRGHRGGWTHATLDGATAEGIDRLMRALGLRFGSIDLLLPEDGGAPFFLEVNPNGEWGHLEQSLELPAAAAIARALVRPT